MELIELTTVEEMLTTYEVLTELYPSLEIEAYRNELTFMVQHNYSQVVVKESEAILGVSGVWIGNKLWCGKYLEIDNIVVSEKARSQGVGNMMVDYLVSKAQALGCTMMALDSYTTNFKAHKFFYNKGFGPKGFHFIHVLDKTKIR
jgi:ribosomal protein S18 acetylase RimI-like enzyme